jgi:hypothetical protein
MSRTFTNLLAHLTFSAKDREPLIVRETGLICIAILEVLLGSSKVRPTGLTARPTTFTC